MINTTNWKEFKVGDLFDYERGKESAPNQNLSGNCKLISEISDNNGFVRFVKPTKIINGHCLTVSVNFANIVFYQEDDFCASVNIMILRPKLELSKNQLLFIASIMSKQHNIYSYTDKINKTLLMDELITLPTKNNQPDFDYMEEYIEEIKLKYIDILEKENNENIDKALKITGLSYQDLNKDLTVKTADRYEEFRVGDLFEIRPTKNHKLVNNDLYDINGINPVIANSGLNNGITGYTNLSCTERGNIITFSDTTDHNSIFYQPYDFVGYSHIQGLYPINHKDKWKSATLLYFMTVFKKMAASYSFSYGNKFTRYKAMNFKLLLPAIDKDTPDFDYMEKAIYIYILLKRLNLKNYLTKKK